MKVNKISLVILPILIVNLILLIVSLFQSHNPEDLAIVFVLVNIMLVVITFIQARLYDKKERQFLNYAIYYVSIISAILIVVLSIIFILLKTPNIFTIVILLIVFFSYLFIYNLLVYANNRRIKR
jgi:cobalamin synthase